MLEAHACILKPVFAFCQRSGATFVSVVGAVFGLCQGTTQVGYDSIFIHTNYYSTTTTLRSTEEMKKPH